jgi:hypothetical protein
MCLASLETEAVKVFNPISAIKERVMVLAEWDSLQRRERLLKEEFMDLFKPIPHVNELPTSVYAEINLKDAQKTIETRTYQCPRKYKEAWKVLIDQHLASGKIRPSKSTHASRPLLFQKQIPLCCLVGLTTTDSLMTTHQLILIQCPV